MIPEQMYFHMASRLDAALPYVVQAAGRRDAPAEAEPISTRFHEHCLILTLAGEGEIEVQGVRSLAPAGVLTWLDTSMAYSHACHSPGEDWSYLWMGIRGQGLDELFTALDAKARPHFTLPDPSATSALFARAIALLQQPGPASTAALSSIVAGLMADLVAQRTAEAVVDADGGNERIARVIRAVRADIAFGWTVRSMAATGGLSPSHFHRLFKEQLGTSPIDWLRHERINRSKRHLGARRNTVAEVALACGYRDPYHFSRDFKRLTGESPSGFRRETQF